MSISQIGVVVVNYASSDLIRQGLPSTSFGGAPVVIVDNFSSAEELGKIAQLTAERSWSLVALPQNRGFGAGVNAGVTRARELGCTIFLLLNPDTEIDAAAVAALAEATACAPRSLVSPRLVDRTGRVTFAGSRLDLRRGRNRRSAADDQPGPRWLDWLTAASLAVHVDLWDAVGGFDESYFMYWEDVDFGYRCAAAGAALVLREDLSVLHDRGGTQGVRRGRAKSSLYYYYNVRNRLLFAARNLPRREILRWLGHTPAASWEVLLRGGRRQLVESPQPAYSVIAGAFAGIWIALRALARPAP